MFAGPIAGPVEIINNMSLGPFQVPYIYIYVHSIYLLSLLSLTQLCCLFSLFQKPCKHSRCFPT